jgi:Tol biopolymer transport system component
MHFRNYLLQVIVAIFCWAMVTRCSQPTLNWPGLHSVGVPANHDLHEPSWSPDGHLVAVAAETTAGQASGELDIVKFDGQSTLRLDKRCPFREPHWSPDGTKLIYVGCDDISVVAYPALTLVATVPGEYADWSPDSSQFAIFDGFPTGIQPSPSVFVSDQSGKPSTVLFVDETAERWAFGGLAWSRNSDRIAFSFGSVPVTSSTALQRDVYIVNSNGTGLAMIGKTHSDEFDPSWSPDGLWVVYISAPEYSSAAIGTITFAKIDGSCFVHGPSSERLSGLDWSPDGESLAITYRNQLYVVDIATMLGQPYKNLDALCPTP